MSLNLFTVIEFVVALLATLIVASWLIVRERQARRARDNFERLVLLENQTLRTEVTAVNDELAFVRLTANSAKQLGARMSHAVLEALTEIDSRVGKLNGQQPDATRADDDHQSRLRASENRRLRSAMDRLASTQKIAEQRLSDEIRFNLDRARIIDTSLKGLASRIDGLSDRLNELMRDLNVPSSGPSPEDSPASQANHPDIAQGSPQAAEESKHLVRLTELSLDQSDTRSTVRPNDEAA